MIVTIVIILIVIRVKSPQIESNQEEKDILKTTAISGIILGIILLGLIAIHSIPELLSMFFGSYFPLIGLSSCYPVLLHYEKQIIQENIY